MNRYAMLNVTGVRLDDAFQRPRVFAQHPVKERPVGPLLHQRQDGSQSGHPGCLLHDQNTPAVGCTARRSNTSPGMTSTDTPLPPIACWIAMRASRGIWDGWLTSSQ
jgi:hypothetical protein